MVREHSPLIMLCESPISMEPTTVDVNRGDVLKLKCYRIEIEEHMVKILNPELKYINRSRKMLSMWWHVFNFMEANDPNPLLVDFIQDVYSVTLLHILNAEWMCDNKFLTETYTKFHIYITGLPRSSTKWKLENHLTYLKSFDKLILNPWKVNGLTDVLNTHPKNLKSISEYIDIPMIKYNEPVITVFIRLIALTDEQCSDLALNLANYWLRCNYADTSILGIYLLLLHDLGKYDFLRREIIELKLHQIIEVYQWITNVLVNKSIITNSIVKKHGSSFLNQILRITIRGMMSRLIKINEYESFIAIIELWIKANADAIAQHELDFYKELLKIGLSSQHCVLVGHVIVNLMNTKYTGSENKEKRNTIGRLLLENYIVTITKDWNKYEALKVDYSATDNDLCTALNQLSFIYKKLAELLEFILRGKDDTISLLYIEVLVSQFSLCPSEELRDIIVRNKNSISPNVECDNYGLSEILEIGGSDALHTDLITIIMASRIKLFSWYMESDKTKEVCDYLMTPKSTNTSISNWLHICRVRHIRYNEKLEYLHLDYSNYKRDRKAEEQRQLKEMRQQKRLLKSKAKEGMKNKVHDSSTVVKRRKKRKRMFSSATSAYKRSQKESNSISDELRYSPPLALIEYENGINYTVGLDAVAPKIFYAEPPLPSSSTDCLSIESFNNINVNVSGQTVTRPTETASSNVVYSGFRSPSVDFATQIIEHHRIGIYEPPDPEIIAQKREEMRKWLQPSVVMRSTDAYVDELYRKYMDSISELE